MILTELTEYREKLENAKRLFDSTGAGSNKDQYAQDIIFYTRKIRELEEL